MKKILIIGAGGQIGSELTTYLRGIYGSRNVVATDVRECKALGADGPFEVLDALNATSVASVVARHEIDTIFNLVALLSAVGERNPQMAWHVNIGALMNSLEVARQHHCALFTPSSIGAFGPSSPKVRTPQDTVMQPTTIYGICKVTGEMLGNYYHHKYGVDTRSIRFPGIISNVTLPGGGTTDYAVEIYYEAIRSGRYTCAVPHDVYMDMIYMPDVLRACVELMEADPARLRHRNSFNIASMSFTPDIIAAEIRKRIPYVLDLVGLDRKGERKPDELSGGEPQAHPLVHDGLQHRSRQGGDRPQLARLARRHLRPRGVGLASRMGSFADDRRHARRDPQPDGASPPRLTYDPRRQRRRRRQVLDGNFSISRAQSRTCASCAETRKGT